MKGYEINSWHSHLGYDELVTTSVIIACFPILKQARFLKCLKQFSLNSLLCLLLYDKTIKIPASVGNMQQHMTLCKPIKQIVDFNQRLNKINNFPGTVIESGLTILLR